MNLATHTFSEHPNDIYALHRSNVWLLYSASDQASLHAGLEHMQSCHDLSRAWGLSLEPLIDRIDLSWMRHADSSHKPGWIIVGGESGPHARPCDVAWIRSIVDQCAAAGVPCFVKQLGAKPYDSEWYGDCTPDGSAMLLDDPEGGDPDEWPEALRVRQFPSRGS